MATATQTPPKKKAAKKSSKAAKEKTAKKTAASKPPKGKGGKNGSGKNGNGKSEGEGQASNPDKMHQQPLIDGLKIASIDRAARTLRDMEANLADAKDAVEAAQGKLKEEMRRHFDKLIEGEERKDGDPVVYTCMIGSTKYDVRYEEAQSDKVSVKKAKAKKKPSKGKRSK